MQKIKMAKYRGKHKGRTRGQYIQKAFWYTQLSEDETYHLREQLHSFLCDRGYCVTADEHSDGDCSVSTYSYHLGGATIGLRVMCHKTTPYKKLQAEGFGTVPQYYVHLKLVSNDSLDDVVQKMCEKFPGCTELDPETL